MREEKYGTPGKDWKWYLSVIAPLILLLGFAVIFSGSSSGSDCGSDSDCSSSSADLTGVCGQPANVDKSGTIRALFPLTIKSAQTDLRCGYGVSWKYSWPTGKKATKAPNVSISVSAPKGGSSKINKSDTSGSDGWAGTYNVARGSVSGKDPVLGTISVTASFTPDSLLGALDSANISLHLVYSSLKK
jgi:hypothetical protein